MENFESGAVGEAAHNGTGVGLVDETAVKGLDMDTAIADGEIEPAVGAFAEPVEVVSEEIDVNTESGIQDLAGIGVSVAVFILEFPEVGNAGVVEIAAIHENARADAGEGVAEAVGVDGCLVGVAVTIGVDDLANAILGVAIGGELIAEVSFHGDQTVINGAVGEVIDEPVGVIAHIGDAVLMAVGFGDIEVALFVHVKTYRIGQHGFGGEEIDFEIGRNPDLLHFFVGLIGGRSDVGFIRRDDGRVVLGNRVGGYHEAGQPRDSEGAERMGVHDVFLA